MSGAWREGAGGFAAKRNDDGGVRWVRRYGEIGKARETHTSAVGRAGNVLRLGNDHGILHFNGGSFGTYLVQSPPYSTLNSRGTLSHAMLAQRVLTSAILVLSSSPVTALLIFLGYLPKRIVQRPEWLVCPNVEVVASVSECISPAPPERIDHWKHNHLGLYDTADLARTIVPERVSDEYTIFAYHALPVVFHDGDPLEWNPWTKAETDPPILEESFDQHLGFDVVGFSNSGFFECSPLSCNGVAKDITVNRFCLLDNVQQAMDVAKNFSRPESRVEPAYGYIVVDVRKRILPP